MDNYLYPHFGMNIKRRALFRGITLVILLVATISILYGVWGPTLTVKVPDDLTAVRLSGPARGNVTWQHTITDPQEVRAFAEVLSNIGTLPRARPNGETYFGYTTVTINLLDSTGGELTYVFSTGGSLWLKDSAEFEFRTSQALMDLIRIYVPEGVRGW